MHFMIKQIKWAEIYIEINLEAEKNIHISDRLINKKWVEYLYYLLPVFYKKSQAGRLI